MLVIRCRVTILKYVCLHKIKNNNHKFILKRFKKIIWIKHREKLNKITVAFLNKYKFK